MSPAQAFLIVLAALAAVVAVLVIIDFVQQKLRQRAKRREIEEHTEKFWRQIG